MNVNSEKMFTKKIARRVASEVRCAAVVNLWGPLARAEDRISTNEFGFRSCAMWLSGETPTMVNAWGISFSPDVACWWRYGTGLSRFIPSRMIRRGSERGHARARGDYSRAAIHKGRFHWHCRGPRRPFSLRERRWTGVGLASRAGPGGGTLVRVIPGGFTKNDAGITANGPVILASISSSDGGCDGANSA